MFDNKVSHPFNSLFKGSLPQGTLWSNDDDKLQNDLFIYPIPKQSAELLKSYKLVIADFSCEHFGDQEGALPAYFNLLDIGINFIFLTHHEPDHLIMPNYLFFPHHYFYKNHLILPQVDSVNKVSKQFKISCLNANSRYHRIYNFLKLRKKAYFSEMLFTFHNGDAYRHDDPKLDKSIIDEWESLRSEFANKDSINFNIPDGENSLPAYTNSYIHLITETTVLKKVFITEKTWKSVASGQLFILLGNPGSIQHLRNLGVDVFDDYIDHNYYDNEPDWQKRIDKIHDLVGHFMSMPNSFLEQINKETQTRRFDNMEKYFTGEFISKYIKCFQDKVNELSIR